MEDNSKCQAIEAYRSAWLSVKELKLKILKLEELKGIISDGSHGSLINKQREDLTKIEPSLQSLRQESEKQLLDINAMIDKNSRSISAVKTKMKDNEVLFENDIIEEQEYYITKKRNEIEIDRITDETKNDRAIAAKIETILEHPDPSEEAASIALKVKLAHEENERVEKERVEKEKIEAQKKWDFELRIEKAKAEIINNAELKISESTKKHESELNHLRSKFSTESKKRRQYEEIIKDKDDEIREKDTEIKNIESANEILNKKTQSYQNRIIQIQKKAQEFSYPCGDKSCGGFVGFDSVCKECGKSYAESKKINAIKLDIEKKKEAVEKVNRFFRIIILILAVPLFLSLPSYGVESLKFFIFLALPILIWKVVTYNMKINIRNIQEYGNQ